MKPEHLSPLDQMIITMYGDIWRHSPVFRIPVCHRPAQEDPRTGEKPTAR